MKTEVTYLLAIILIGCYTSCEKTETSSPRSLPCFSYGPTTNITTNTEIVFMNCSENNISNNWNFGDGSTSSTKNPIHFFSQAGEYEVRLITSNGTISDSLIQTIHVGPSGTLNNYLLIQETGKILLVDMEGNKNDYINTYQEDRLDKAYIETQVNRIYLLANDTMHIYTKEGYLIYSQPSSTLPFALLPDYGIAKFNNAADAVYFCDSSFNSIGWFDFLLEDPSNDHSQNTEHVVVDNTLIISENGENQLLKVNLDTYEMTIFRDFSHLPYEGCAHWLGAIAYYEGTYYLCDSEERIYSFQENSSESLVCELPENNITGLVIIDGYAYATVNFSGEVYKIDISNGHYSLFLSGLDYPDDIEILRK